MSIKTQFHNRTRQRIRCTMIGLFTSILVSACASGPIKTEADVASLSVAQARAMMIEEGALNSLELDTVLWGGVILNVRNFADTTQIELMAYPLDRHQRPMPGRSPDGRFLVQYGSFLEPVDYAEGRSISVLGTVSGVTTGTIGEAQYKYPTVVASDIHLWKENELDQKPQLTFGIGVNIGL